MGLFLEYSKNQDMTKRIQFPNEINPELLYFVGVIVGDGSLPIKHNGDNKRSFVITIEKANEKFIVSVLKPLAERLFGVKWSITTRLREGRKQTWCLYLYSKAVYRFLVEKFDFSEGKKSGRIRMPLLVRNLKPRQRIPFIAGVMDTDWGVLGNGFGTHCSSRMLLVDVRDVLRNLLGINPKIKRYFQGKFVSYQMRLGVSQKAKLFNALETYFPLRNHKRRLCFQCRGG